MDVSPFPVRERLLFFKEEGQSNTKVREGDKNIISLSGIRFSSSFFKSDLEGCFLSENSKWGFFFISLRLLLIFSWVKGNKSNDSTGPLMRK